MALQLKDDLGILEQKKSTLNLKDDLGIFEKQPESVKTEGLSYIKEHPFKSMFQGLAKTLTGESFEDRAHKATAPDEIKPGEGVGGRYVDAFAKQALSGMAGTVADIATTPASYLPVPGAGLVGKIPVGKTNVGRVATNIAVKFPNKAGREAMSQSVKELQRMEAVLEQSGKLSSRGIYPQKYSEGIVKGIVNAYNQAINPSTGKFKNQKDLNSYQNQVVKATETINDYLPVIKFENPVTGIKESRLPTNRAEYLDALTQAKGEIYKQYSSLAQSASKEGAKIDLAVEVRKVTSSLLENERVQRYAPELIPKIKALEESIAGGKLLSPEEAQKDIQFLNEKLASFYRNPSMNEQSIAVVYAGVVRNLRQATDEAIEQALGRGGYQDLKSKYGALKTIESDLTKAVARQIKNTGNRGIVAPVADVLSGGEVANALFKLGTGQPGGAESATRAIGLQGVKALRQWLSNPDKRIENMFKDVSKAVKQSKEVNPLFTAIKKDNAKKPIVNEKGSLRISGNNPSKVTIKSDKPGYDKKAGELVDTLKNGDKIVIIDGKRMRFKRGEVGVTDEKGYWKPLATAAIATTALSNEAEAEEKTLGQKNNNPINLKAFEKWEGMTGKDKQGHAIFKDKEHGVRAAYKNIYNHMKANPNQTLKQYFNKFAEENGDKEAEYIAKKLGVKPDAKLSSLSADGVTIHAAMFESKTSITQKELNEIRKKFKLK